MHGEPPGPLPRHGVEGVPVGAAQLAHLGVQGAHVAMAGMGDQVEWAEMGIEINDKKMKMEMDVGEIEVEIISISNGWQGD